MAKPKNSTENLCDTCENRSSIPECLSDDIEFGDGVGDDNIIECPNFSNGEQSGE